MIDSEEEECEIEVPDSEDNYDGIVNTDHSITNNDKDNDW